MPTLKRTGGGSPDASRCEARPGTSVTLPSRRLGSKPGSGPCSRPGSRPPSRPSSRPGSPGSGAHRATGGSKGALAGAMTTPSPRVDMVPAAARRAATPSLDAQLRDVDMLPLARMWRKSLQIPPETRGPRVRVASLLSTARARSPEALPAHSDQLDCHMQEAVDRFDREHRSRVRCTERALHLVGVDLTSACKQRVLHEAMSALRRERFFLTEEPAAAVKAARPRRTERPRSDWRIDESIWGPR